MTYKKRRRRRKVRRKQRGGYVNKLSKLPKIGMPMAMAAYDAYKKQQTSQKGGSNQRAIIARRFGSFGRNNFPNQYGGSNQRAIIARRFGSFGRNNFPNQYGYGIRNKYGIAPRKSFYIHK